MGFSNDAKNAMLNHIGTQITYVSLHTASPATSGNEISGGSPAYARKSITWATASNGSKAASNQPSFDVPAGKTVAAVGFWSAATGGTMYGDDDVTPETFANQGTYTLTSVTLSLT
jgi:hypothetical protein